MATFSESAVAGDDPRLESVYSNFERNLRDIVDAARSCGAGVVLSTVACNLRDCPPFLSVHRRGLGGAELESWSHSFNRGRIDWMLGDAKDGKRALSEALAIDPQYADTAFMLGSLELASGDVKSARSHLVQAAHWDALRFRPDPRINAAVRRVASECGARLVDAADFMGSDPASSAPVAGRDLLFEHVHFDWNGNYALARALAEASAPMVGGASPAIGNWLDSGQCAEAVGYTAHERASVLEHLRTIVQKPPFTNQLTYVPDQARFAAQFAAQSKSSRDPAALMEAGRVLDTAVAADTENPALAILRQACYNVRGDLAGSLVELRRAEALQPRSAALEAEEAMKLSRLGKYDEAEQLLLSAHERASTSERALLAPAFAELYTRTRRLSEGQAFFASEIERAPRDLSLVAVRARMERLCGETGSAERDYRAVLASEPSSEAALEGLVDLLQSTGRLEESEKESVAAESFQPGNASNNLRASVIHDRRGETDKSILMLLAAERSGPVSASVEVRIAKALLAQGDTPEGALHLALARLLAEAEGNGRAVSALGEAIDQLRASLP
jgi:tetratricopeptide (TPR) repeat protein